LPWALGFAAGAVLFVISGEIIPETHRGKPKGLATSALRGGFPAMTAIGIVLGSRMKDRPPNAPGGARGRPLKMHPCRQQMRNESR